MPEDDFRTHEILLENRHLAFTGVGVLVLCLGAFLLGRWTERSRWVNPDSPLPQVAGAAESLPIGSGPGGGAALPAQGVESEDLLSEEELPAAPVAEQPAAAEPQPRAEKGRGERSPSDDLYIQVLATRHADAAGALRDRLASRNYPATVVSAPDSQGRALYRVRVGGYASREEAERVASRLEKEERLKTWIP